LALASIYYGGDAFQEGTAKAEASTVINQGQQVQAAVTMAEIDEVVVTNLETDLVPTYLKEIPQVRSAAWTLDGNFVKIDVVNADVCGHVEASFDGDATLGADDAADAQAFGCYLDVDATKHVAYYKL
jgi:hypothetical protein